jgi:hypothetical protein
VERYGAGPPALKCRYRTAHGGFGGADIERLVYCLRVSDGDRCHCAKAAGRAQIAPTGGGTMNFIVDFTSIQTLLRS